MTNLTAEPAGAARSGRPPDSILAERISLWLMILAGLMVVLGGIGASSAVQIEYSGHVGEYLRILTTALAFFCLGVGAAYLVFARYRDSQAENLREDYGRLLADAENLGRVAMKPAGSSVVPDNSDTRPPRPRGGSFDL